MAMRGGGEKEAGCNLHPWEVTVKEDRVPHPGKPPHLQEDQWGQKGNYAGSEESITTGLWQAEQKDLHRQRNQPACSSLKTSILWYGQGLVLKLGV